MADFTTLANAKQYLRITGAGDDALLTRLISAATGYMQKYMNRDILAANYNELFDGTNNQFHVVGNYPINSISFVYAGATSIMPAATPEGVGYVNDDNMIVLNGYAFPKGRLNCRVMYNAGFTSVPEEIEQACLEIIGIKYKQIEHLDQSSKVVAGETVSFIISDIPASAKTIMKNYKKVISF